MLAATDLTAAAGRWPRFAPAARQAGFAAVQALPMRLRTQIIGALNLFRVAAGPFGEAETRVGQALADVATISLLHERSLRRSETPIEQAKGKLAERAGIDMDQAFEILRSYAKARNRRLSELAMAFVTGSEDLPALSAGQSPLPGPGQPPR